MSLLARLFGCRSQDSASSCFGRPGVPLVSEIEIFCRYGEQSHSCFVESNTDPVYAFEYSVELDGSPGAIPQSITRGCRLGLTDGIVEQGDDFTKLQRLKPEYYTRDQTLMARGPPRICEHSFEYAKIENDVRVVDRDIYTGR
ncbi:hypothetical protein FOZ60_004657 [Perkinsus olseni]|uniref:Uncharacterized protein n=1 Tax=Perkinsus olseni TaxID=32597 RepID=A0A7J6NSR8_PEROL|nr:hypothetical protein FOZ60_004657 [Perkinsus olseni]